MLQPLALQVLLNQRIQELKYQTLIAQQFANFGNNSETKEQNFIANFSHAPLLAPQPAWF